MGFFKFVVRLGFCSGSELPNMHLIRQGNWSKKMLRTTLPSIFFKFIIRLSGAQYVTMQKCFSHPSLIIYFFLTPPIKIKLGVQIGGRLLIETHLDQSNTLANKQQVC
jgi:hypothetical protein